MTDTATLLTQVQDLLARQGIVIGGNSDILVGTVDDPDSFNEDGGKTGVLGYYPLPLPDGGIQYFPCLKRLQLDASAGADPEAVAGLLNGKLAEGAAQVAAATGAKDLADASADAAAGALSATQALEQAFRSDFVGLPETVDTIATFVKPNRPEAGGGPGTARFRIGNRVFATWDRTIGFKFLKMTLAGGVTTVDDKPAVAIKDRLLAGAVGGSFNSVASTLVQGFRFRIGRRLYMTIDPAAGVYPRKATLPSNTKVDDDLSADLAGRLVSSGVGRFLRVPKTEASPGMGFRWRIGNRLLATLDIAKGFYPRRLTIPASAKVDDDLNTPLISRLLGAAVGNYFKVLRPEAGGGVLRFRLGNRLLGQWTKAGGMQWVRQTLPADCKIADKPTVNLVDRLGGNIGSYAENSGYIATTVLTEAGTNRRVVRCLRKSDMQQFSGLSGDGYNAFIQQITADNKIIFFADALDSYLFVAAEGGTPHQVVSDSRFIDCWGDSLTMGSGAFGGGPGQGSYPKQLQDMMGAVVTINNYGQGGQWSPEIAARQGGAPALMTVTGNQIPASGTVALTAYSQDILILGTDNGAITVAGSLAGVPGVLSGTHTTGRQTSIYSFTRTTPGDVVACPPNTPFIPSLGLLTQDRINLLKMGVNFTTAAGIKADIASCVAYLKPIYKRFLVLSYQTGPATAGTGTQTQGNDMNAYLAATYGDNYLDINSAPTTEEMATLGFVPDSGLVYSNFHTDAADLAGKACGGFVLTALPANADTVTINGTVVTFVTGAPSGAQVQIAGTLVDTAANLAAYVNVNASALGVTARSGIDIGGVVRVNLAATVAGAAGNNIALAKSSAGITASGAKLANGTSVPVLPSGMMSGASMVGWDFTHRNNVGYGLEALRVYRKIFAKGWYPTLTPK